MKLSLLFTWNGRFNFFLEKKIQVFWKGLLHREEIDLNIYILAFNIIIWTTYKSMCYYCTIFYILRAHVTWNSWNLFLVGTYVLLHQFFLSQVQIIARACYFKHYMFYKYIIRNIFFYKKNLMAKLVFITQNSVILPSSPCKFFCLRSTLRCFVVLLHTFT